MVAQNTIISPNISMVYKTIEVLLISNDFLKNFP